MSKRALATALALLGLALGSPAQAGWIEVFSDDFEDGDTVGWDFVCNDASEWGVEDLGSNKRLNSSIAPGSDDLHDTSGDSPGFALISGVTTPDHFRLSAQVSVERYDPGQDPDRGHVGFVYGFLDGQVFDEFNNHYLRTHNNHLANWSTSGGVAFPNDATLSVGSNVTNNVTYDMMIEVDFNNRSLIATFGGAVIGWFSGNDFNNAIRHQGGGIGLQNWGEEVTYDNVLLEAFHIPVPAPATAAVPGPATAVLLGIGLLGLRISPRRS